MRILLVWLINALSLLAVPYVLPSVSIDSFYVALVTALLLGLVNTLIRPLLVIVTLPITILTLGLFTLVINGLLFWFVASFVQGFHVGGFWSAFWGAHRLQRDFVGGELAADAAAGTAASAAPAAARLYRFDLAPAVGPPPPHPTSSGGPALRAPTSPLPRVRGRGRVQLLSR